MIYQLFPKYLSSNGEFVPSNMTMKPSTESYSYTQRTQVYKPLIKLFHYGPYGYSVYVNSRTFTILWDTSVNRNEENVTIWTSSGTPFTEFIDAPCSIGSTTFIRYSLASADNQSQTSWLNFTEENFTLSGTPPDAYENKVYKYKLIAVWATTPSGIAITEIIINTTGKVQPTPAQPTPAQTTPVQDTKATSASKSGNFAIVMVCIQIIIAIIFAAVEQSLDTNTQDSTQKLSKSLYPNKTSFVTLWQVLNHTQILLLLLLVDGYGPESVYDFMEF